MALVGSSLWPNVPNGNFQYQIYQADMLLSSTDKCLCEKVLKYLNILKIYTLMNWVSIWKTTSKCRILECAFWCKGFDREMFPLNKNTKWFRIIWITNAIRFWFIVILLPLPSAHFLIDANVIKRMSMQLNKYEFVSTMYRSMNYTAWIQLLAEINSATCVVLATNN